MHFISILESMRFVRENREYNFNFWKYEGKLLYYELFDLYLKTSLQANILSQAQSLLEFGLILAPKHVSCPPDRPARYTYNIIISKGYSCQIAPEWQNKYRPTCLLGRRLGIRWRNTSPCSNPHPWESERKNERAKLWKCS